MLNATYVPARGPESGQTYTAMLAFKYNLLSIYFLIPSCTLEMSIPIQGRHFSRMKLFLFINNVSAVFISQHKTQIPINLVKETF